MLIWKNTQIQMQVKMGRLTEEFEEEESYNDESNVVVIPVNTVKGILKKKKWIH